MASLVTTTVTGTLTTSSNGSFGGANETSAKLFVRGGNADFWNSTNSLLRINHDGTRANLQSFTGGAYDDLAINPDGGSVGIGTNNPSDHVEINAAQDKGLTIDTSSDVSPRLTISRNGTGRLNLNAGNARGQIQAWSANGLALLDDGNNLGVFIKDGGYVGIGTDAPSNNLEVTANANYGGINIGQSTGHVRHLDFTRTATHANPTARIRVAEPGATHTSNMKFYTSDASGSAPNLVERMTIDEAGNIGVGVSDPDAKLEIKGTGGGTGLTFKTTDSSSNNIFWVMDGGKTGLHYYPFVINQDNSDSDCPAATFFYVHHATAPFTIKNDGKVGIGTTDPAVNLEVSGTNPAFDLAQAGTSIFRIELDGANDVYQTVYGSGNKWLLRVNSSTNALTADGNGQIGIGTATPGSNTPLHIYTNSASDQTIFLDNDSTGQTGITLRTDRNSEGNAIGFIYFDGNDGGNVNTRYATIEAFIVDNLNGSEDGSLRFSVMAGGNDVESMTIAAKSGTSDIGWVGVGTTAPHFPLQVLGVSQTNGDAKRVVCILDSTSAAAGTGAGIALGGYTNGTASAINDFGVIQGIKENGTAGNYASAMLFSTRANGGNPTERMRINSSGNVGINRTSPYGKLDIGSTDLGSSSGDVSVASRSQSDVGSNTMYLLEEYVRTSAGTDWTSAGVRLQAKTDSTYQGYIQFNGDSNNYGLSFGAGAGGTSSPGTTAERMRIQSDGKVGIGTTDPAALLHVDGTVRVGVDDAGHDVMLYGATTSRYWEWDASHDLVRQRDNVKTCFGNGDDLEIYHDGSNSHIKNSGSLYVASETSGDLYLRSDDDIFIQPQGGENGITLTGDGAVSLYYDNSKKFETTSSGVEATLYGFDKGGSSIGGYLELTNQAGDASSNDVTVTAAHSTNSVVLRAAQKVEFYTYASSAYQLRMRILNDGKVGIGTTNPTNNLVVYATGHQVNFVTETDDHSGMRVKGAAAKDKYILFNDQCKIGYQHSTATLHLCRSAAFGDNHLVINSSGSVGIGTDNPGQKLHVNVGKIAVSDGYNIGSVDGETGMYVDQDTDIRWQVGGSHLMTLTSAGVVSLSSAGNTQVNNYYASLIINNTGTSTWSRLRFDRSGVERWGIGLGTDDKLRISNLFTGGSAASPNDSCFVIDNNGQIGINVDPDGGLKIKSRADGENVLNMVDSAGDAMFNIRQSSNDCLIRAYKDGGSQKVQIHTDGDSYFMGGNVGIGTTNPEHRLDVHGGGGGTFGAITNRQSANANTDGIATVNYDAGNNSLRLWVDGSGNRKINAGSTEIISFTTSAVSIAKSTTITGTATATTFSGSGASLTSLNASNLGSGTVPTARLGSGTASSSTYLRGDNTWAAVSGGSGMTTDQYVKCGMRESSGSNDGGSITALTWTTRDINHTWTNQGTGSQTGSKFAAVSTGSNWVTLDAGDYYTIFRANAVDNDYGQARLETDGGTVLVTSNNSEVPSDTVQISLVGAGYFTLASEDNVLVKQISENTQADYGLGRNLVGIGATHYSHNVYFTLEIWKIG
jgi:hypothetical protein